MATGHSPIGQDLSRALRILRSGGLVAIPTETVYGLAADASQEAAVRRIFAVKRRPADHPVIVHVDSVDAAWGWAREVSTPAKLLAAACWPGPLTLLLPRASHVLDAVTGGRDAVGLRVPAHPMTLELLSAFGGGLAAPSANRFGRVSPTRAEHVLADLGDDVDYIFDGGPCPLGVESTIVDCCADPPQVLRPGGIADEDIARLLGAVASAAGPSRASGMLESHYAPRCRVLLAESPGQAQTLTAKERAAGCLVEVLDYGDDLVAYAQDLYARLRAADRDGMNVVVAVLPAPVGLGHALRDRLTKAAAAR